MNRRPILLLGLVTATAASGAAPPDDARFAAQTELVRTQMRTNPDNALRLTGPLRATAATLGDAKARERALVTVDWLRAEALTRTNRPAESLKIATAALRRAAQVVPNSRLMGDLALARGGAAAATGDVQRALSDYQWGFRIYQQAHEPRQQSLALQNIGSLYNDARDYQNALRYEQQALESYAGEPALELTAYNTRGNALIELGQSRAAVVEYRKALVAARKMASPMLETRVLQNLARSQANSGEYDAAETTLNAAYAIARNGPAAAWRPALDGVAALVALRRNRLDQAHMLIERTFAEAGRASAMMPLRDFHLTAYQIYRARGQRDAALSHYESYHRLDDEQRALAASTNAALMSARFDAANKDLKIERLNAGQAARDREIERAGARLRATVLIGLLAAASVIVTLLLIGFFSIRRSRNQVRAANQTLSATNKKLEKALAAKTEFLATTSHEIRTPLNGILGMTQVILADRGLPAPVRERVALVQGSGETMKALVDDILDVAKMETGEIAIHPAPLHLVRLLGDAAKVWTDQATAKQLALEIDLADAPVMIMADEVRLRQIVFNLMANAIKFTDQGCVRLIAAAVSPAEGGERLMIRIEDSGIGIPDDQLDTIFESFRQIDGGTTRRHGGTGLGLTICRNLARAMGGDVMVASTLGAGSVFSLDLPLERCAAPAATAQRAIGCLAEADLLLVEANPLSQGIMRAVLGGAVGGLHIVADGEAALAALAAGGIDHVLADGASLGLDSAAARRLADATEQAGARLTILWPTPDDAVRQALAAAGVNHLVAKPIGAADLLAALQKVYAARMAGQDIAA